MCRRKAQSMDRGTNHGVKICVSHGQRADANYGQGLIERGI